MLSSHAGFIESSLPFQLCHASEAAGSFNRNQPSQQELSTQCKAVLDAIPELIGAVSDMRRSPDSVQAVRNLIDKSKALLQVCILLYITYTIVSQCS